MRETRFQLGKPLPLSAYQASGPLFFVGLDLGQRADYSAISVIQEPLWIPDYLDTWVKGEELPVSGRYVSPTDLMEPLVSFFARRAATAKRNHEAAQRHGEPLPPALPRARPVLDLRYLYRWPLGSSYPSIVAAVGELLSRPPLTGYARLAIDATGVGVAITDLFKQAGIPHTAITITGGNTVNAAGSAISVPKRDLAMCVQRLLQSDRLRFAAALPELDALKQELQSFEVRISAVSGHDTYEAWRRADSHDDMVLSVACAAWLREWTNDRSGGAFQFSYLEKSDAPAYPLD